MLNKNFLIITPTFNEIDNIQNFLDEVINRRLSVLVIDDNSPDGTSEIVKRMKKNNSNIHLITREKKLGLGSAYREGFNWFIKSDYSHCIEMDTDFSHTFRDLKKILSEITNYDLVIGSRYIDGGGSTGWDKKRKMLSKYANKFAKKLLNSEINDLTSGFRSYSKTALISSKYESTVANGYGFQIEMANRIENKNLKILEVPITFEERRLGESKMSLKISIEAFILLLKLRIK